MPDQFSLFSEAMALGLLLGAYYDIFRALRACCRVRNLTLVFITDSLFWVTATIYCLWFIFYYRWGEIYTYTYFGLAVGAAAYFFWLSSYLFKLWHKIFSAVIRAGLFIRRAIQRGTAMVALPVGRASAGVGVGLKRVKNISPLRRVFRYIYRKRK